MKNRRVILDTNLWISFLISKRQEELDLLLESGEVTLIFSEELLEEFLEVSGRPKFKKFFKKSDIKTLLAQIEFFGELIKVESKVTECRDPKDNFLLSLSIDGKADFLITGDSDMLVLGKIENTNSFMGRIHCSSINESRHHDHTITLDTKPVYGKKTKLFEVKWVKNKMPQRQEGTKGD